MGAWLIVLFVTGVRDSCTLVAQNLRECRVSTTSFLSTASDLQATRSTPVWYPAGEKRGHAPDPQSPGSEPEVTMPGAHERVPSSPHRYQASVLAFIGAILLPLSALAAIVEVGEILVAGHHGFDAVDPETGTIRRVLETSDIGWNLDVAVTGDGHGASRPTKRASIASISSRARSRHCSMYATSVLM